jgi:5,10-methylenetetrahydromethanopterin reductase
VSCIRSTEATILAPGRAFFGIGSGDSAILNLAERPSTLADLRAYIETVRALHTKGETTWRGRLLRLTWAKRAIPIYLSAEGPRTLELAGEIADGVIVNVGLEPALVTDAVAHVHAGARRAGRDPSAIDLWTMVRANVPTTWRAASTRSRWSSRRTRITSFASRSTARTCHPRWPMRLGACRRAISARRA